jgi:hypothetical protein
MMSKTKKQAINKTLANIHKDGISLSYYPDRLTLELFILGFCLLVLLHQTGIVVMVP